MGLFDFVKKKQVELTEEQKKWNKMWELWEEEKVDEPYHQIMTYQNEVNNGGHDQYFTNVENAGDLQIELTILTSILSKTLAENLHKAYQAYLVSKKEDNQNTEEVITHCDDVFYEHEAEINSMLQEYAIKIKL